MISAFSLFFISRLTKRVKFMYIDVNTRAEEEKNRERYLWLDQFYNPAVGNMKLI